MVYPGRNAHVDLGSDKVAEITTWTLTCTYDLAECITFERAALVPTTSKWTARVEGYLDISNASQSQLRTGEHADNLRLFVSEFVCYMPEEGAVVTQVEQSTSADGVAKLTVGFAGRGRLLCVELDNLTDGSNNLTTSDNQNLYGEVNVL